MVDRRTLERLFADMRENFDRGASFADVLGRAVCINEAGAAVPGPFTRNVLFNIKQDELKQVRSNLDELLKLARSRPRTFYPLSSPNFFLKFADLGGKEVNEEDVMDWVHRYGILGLGLREHTGDVPPTCLGGPQETVAVFAREAEEANWIKRVYEAALLIDSTDDEVVQQAMRGLGDLFGWSAHNQLSSQECQDKALRAVRLGVQSHLDHHCQVKWRRAGNGLVEFLEFKNALGAMYLQLAWVLRDKSTVRRCKYCSKPVEGYKNKQFCARSCKDHFRNQLKRQELNEERLSFSVPSAIKEEVETLAAMRGVDVNVLFREMLQAYTERNQAK